MMLNSSFWVSFAAEAGLYVSVMPSKQLLFWFRYLGYLYRLIVRLRQQEGK
jgi:hypothetical protein